MSRTHEDFEVIEKPKRAASKRATSVSPETSEKPKPTRRKTASTNVSAEVTKRKAPTTLSPKGRTKSPARKHAAIIATLLIIGVGGSAVIGFTDPGQIDVVKTITERNEQAKNGGTPNPIMVPVQSTTQEPDGGLVGLGIGGPEEKPATTSSSTEATASSTEDVGQAPLTNAEAEAAALNESTNTTAQ
jgi:hypothetical protein